MKTIVKKLVELSPYDVCFETIVDFPFAGLFDHCEYYSPKPKIIIDIGKIRGNFLAVLLHELGHARHYKRKCKCYRPRNRVLAELHAYKFELRALLYFNETKELKKELSDIKEDYPCSSSTYCQTYDKLFKTKLWQRCWDKCFKK